MAYIELGHILNFKADMKHKYADILQAIAEDKDVKLEQKYLSTKDWESTNSDNALAFIAAGCGKLIRIAPKTIRIGDMDVPMPMRVAPAVGTAYWVVAGYYPDLAQFVVWNNGACDISRLKRGLCHLPEAACRTHAEALIKVSGGVL